MKKKLKIGFFTDTYQPQINGVVSSIESFRRELLKQGHQVYIICPRLGVTKKEKNIIRFRSFKFIFQPEYQISIPFSRHLIMEFWRKDLDIVHAHTPFSLGNLGYFYAQIKKIPFVYTYHTLYPEYVKSYFLKGRVLTPKMVKKLAGAFSNLCDLNIAPSDKIKKYLRSYGVTQPIKVLPTGINLPDFSYKTHNNFRNKYKIAKQDKVLLFVGRLGREKNVDFLIDSFVFIKRQSPTTKLVIVGDGPYKKNLINLVKTRNLVGRVIFTGYLNKKRVISAYQAADIFVFASKTDTQGMVILESAACGLPIVAVRDAAFTNMLCHGQNGFATGPSKQLFAKQVFKLLADKKLYDKMSHRSKIIARQFSIANQTRELIKYYTELLK